MSFNYNQYVEEVPENDESPENVTHQDYALPQQQIPRDRGFDMNRLPRDNVMWRESAERNLGFAGGMLASNSSSEEDLRHYDEQSMQDLYESFMINQSLSLPMYTYGNSYGAHDMHPPISTALDFSYQPAFVPALPMRNYYAQSSFSPAYAQPSNSFVQTGGYSNNYEQTPTSPEDVMSQAPMSGSDNNYSNTSNHEAAPSSYSPVEPSSPLRAQPLIPQDHRADSVYDEQTASGSNQIDQVSPSLKFIHESGSNQTALPRSKRRIQNIQPMRPVRPRTATPAAKTKNGRSSRGALVKSSGSGAKARRSKTSPLNPSKSSSTRDSPRQPHQDAEESQSESEMADAKKKSDNRDAAKKTRGKKKAEQKLLKQTHGLLEIQHSGLKDTYSQLKDEVLRLREQAAQHCSTHDCSDTELQGFLKRKDQPSQVTMTFQPQPEGDYRKIKYTGPPIEPLDRSPRSRSSSSKSGSSSGSSGS